MDSTRALSTGKMQAQSSRLGQKESSHSRRLTFRRATTPSGRLQCSHPFRESGILRNIKEGRIHQGAHDPSPRTSAPCRICRHCARGLVPPSLDDPVGTLGDPARLVWGDDAQDYNPGLTSDGCVPMYSTSDRHRGCWGRTSTSPRIADKTADQIPATHPESARGNRDWGTTLCRESHSPGRTVCIHRQ